VRGTVLPTDTTVATDQFGLPFSPPAELGNVSDSVLLRADVEDDYGRRLLADYPLRERWERGRDFVVGDATGRALVRTHSDGAGYWPVDPQLTLHLDGSFREAPLGPRHLYLRTLRVGDPVWLHAPASLAALDPKDDNVVALATSGYRGTPELLVLGNCDPARPLAWDIYDEPAFEHHATWEPWHRKLSVLVRRG